MFTHRCSLSLPRDITFLKLLHLILSTEKEIAIIPLYNQKVFTILFSFITYQQACR